MLRSFAERGGADTANVLARGSTSTTSKYLIRLAYMQLLRNALITFGEEPKRRTMSGEIGSVIFETSPVTFENEPRPGCFISAAVHLERFPEIDGDGFVEIPETPTADVRIRD